MGKFGYIGARPTQSSSSSSSGFQREVVTGNTKICYYKTLGGVKAYNTSSVNMCPISYPY